MLSLRLVGRVAISRGCASALTFATLFVLMHELTAAEFGLYSYYFSLFTAFILIPGLGTNSGYVVASGVRDFREIGRKFFACKLLLIALCLVSILAGWLSNLISTPVAICTVAGALYANGDFLLAVMQAQKKFRQYTWLQLVRSMTIFSVCMFTIYLVGAKNPEAIFVGILITAVISFFSVGIFLLREIGTEWGLKFLPDVLSYSRSFVLFELAAIIMMRAELWMLSFFLGIGIVSAADLGSYMAGYSFSFALPLLTSAVQSLILPHTKGADRLFSPEFKLFERRMVGGVLIFVVGYSLISCVLVRLFFAGKYFHMDFVIPGIVLGMGMSFFAGIARLKAISKGFEAGTNVVTAFQLATSVVANAVLIYVFGIYGAVIAFVLVRLVAFLGYTRLTKGA